MASDAASGLSLNDPLGAAERRERARAVASDLEAIFGAAQPAPAPARPVARPVGGVRRDDEAPRRLSAASIGGIAAAALAGIAAGALLMKAPTQTARPSHPAALPVQLVPPAQPPRAADAALATPAEPLQVGAPPALPAPSEGHPAARVSAGRSEVIAADRRLRAAYAAAIRAGVPRGELSDLRDRWSSARRRNADRPDRLVASYRAIAADMNRAASHAHGRPGRTARAERRSLFHPRFAAWWR